MRDRLSIAVVGHVDHGKSTLVGRLLADAGGLPEGRLEALREQCARNAKPLEYAYLLDALKDEQSQGVTIETARCFFRAPHRDIVFLDAPGHIEFLRNMVTGAARADAALLVIDAREGVQENSRRHGYFLSALGIGQFAVVINKMDLVGYDRIAFEAIAAEYRGFLEQLAMRPVCFVPASAREGANVAAPSPQMAWYTGPTVLDALDRFQPPRQEAGQPLRIPVQDVYKFTAEGDDRRIIAGRVESGVVRPGDAVVFSPSGKRAVVKSLEAFGRPAPAAAGPGESIGLTLHEQVYVARGETISREDQQAPDVTARFRADVFWLDGRDLGPDRACWLKVGTAEVPVRVERVERVLDASTLAVAGDRQAVHTREVATCVLRAERPVAVDDYAHLPKTGRFVLVADHAIGGGGVVREVLEDDESALRAEALLRDRRWIRSAIAPAARAERYGQQAAVVLITGPREAPRKELARELEQSLFGQGRMVYYLGMGSVVYGVDADILKSHLGPGLTGREHIRRFGEVLHVLLDAGLIVICTAVNL
ncbi:MAG: 50S ribosome-binding GTPase, partial [Planctomycetes bacterium]|nr:50S ribosome-binding GTPase [Planctomycetota bacterium]